MATTERDRLPNRRHSFVQKAKVGGHVVYLTCGLYGDDRLGEIFVDLNKQGSALRAWASAFATLFSVSLQHGVPLETLVEMFVGSRSSPCGPVEGHPRITQCASIMDYVARSLAIDFLGRSDLADVEAGEATATPPEERTVGYVSKGNPW